ncbi:hypothetical protein NIES4074_31460 [Cylindrospermum sp. NIES-4074]|nr:hypothetical protein NIES4074_31460 [Cylindrospermum sp. NIES-4074]
MLTMKRKQLTWGILLLMGFGYFSAMSNLEMHYILKSLIAFMPIQGLALIYVTYINWSRR